LAQFGVKVTCIDLDFPRPYVTAHINLTEDCIQIVLEIQIERLDYVTNYNFYLFDLKKYLYENVNIKINSVVENILRKQ